MINNINFTNLNIVGKTNNKIVYVDHKSLFVPKLKLRMEGINSKLGTEQCYMRGWTQRDQHPFLGGAGP